MQYSLLGKTGIKVSRLCFGALTIGPLQVNLPLHEGANVIAAALNAGVNFIDTAELYRTYSYIKEGIEGRAQDVVISAKSYAYTYEGMQESVYKACTGIGRDYIDIFSLHEQTSRLTLKGHRPALQYLIDAKRQGIIRAIGVSTHTVEVVRAAAMIDEIDVIHPIYNMRGLGICDGQVEDMQQAIDFAAYMGKGIYTMKALGGGHLCTSAMEAIKWVLDQPKINAVAVGMQSSAEVQFNAALFSGQDPDEQVMQTVQAKPRKVLVEHWCIGCGACAAKCPMKAIQIIEKKAVVDTDKCVTCGYCGAYCPEFCIKII